MLFLCAYPYFLRDHYFSMTRAKTLFFYGITGFTAVGCLIAHGITKKQTGVRLVRKNPTEMFLTIFIASALVSCVAAEAPLESLVGAQGRYMGLLTFLFIWVAYLCVSRFCRFTSPLAVIFGVSVIGMATIALLQYAKLDPFHLYVGTKATVKRNFIALIGNKDVYYSYLALVVPFSMYLSFSSPTKKEKAFWHAVAFFGFTGVFACRAEGALLFVIPAFAVLFFLKCSDREGMLTFLRNVILFFAAALLIKLLNYFKSPLSRVRSTVIDLLLHPAVIVSAILLCVILSVLFLKLNPKPKYYMIQKRAVACVAGAAAVGIVGAFVYFSFIGTEVRLGSFGPLLRYSDKWGSSRGFVWTRLYRTFTQHFSWLQRLIGSGEETVGTLMSRYWSKDTKALKMPFFDNAHNELLQYLMTQGLLGLLSYLFFVGNAIRSAFRSEDSYRQAAALAALCYLVQSTVNISQAITTPLFFIFLALTQTQALQPAGGQLSVSSKK